MISDVSKELRSNGYVFLEEYFPELSADDAIGQVGVIDSVDGLEVIQNLRPLESVDALPNTYSGAFGKSEFPLHTDLAHWGVPPRYLTLRCIHGSDRVETRILDAAQLIRPNDGTPLQRVLVRPRRPVGGALQLLHLVEKAPAGEACFIRWDSVYLVPATKRSKPVFEELAKQLSQAQTTSVFLASPGDTLIIDNWRMLHGRSAVPGDSEHRHIQRAYLKEII